jgi:hypothetical protein
MLFGRICRLTFADHSCQLCILTALLLQSGTSHVALMPLNCLAFHANRQPGISPEYFSPKFYADACSQDLTYF